MLPLVILGGGRCVWDDYALIHSIPHDIMAINDIGMHVPSPLTHWYSNDAAMLPRWAACRRYEGVGRLHTNNGAGVAVRHDIRLWSLTGGNSGINAVHVGFGLGYDNITVCGIPLDGSGWYFSPPWEISHYDNDYELDAWRSSVVNFSGRVRSMSGRTREILHGTDDN